MKALIISLLSIFIISSCTITNEFHFNKNFSGNAKLTVDMGVFVGLMQSMDTTSQEKSLSDSLKDIFNENITKLEDNKGISNITFNWVDSLSIMILKYNFKDIKSLNKSLNATNKINDNISKDTVIQPHVYFIKKGRKTLIYNGEKSTKSKKTSKEMASMKDYYKYNIIFTFDRKIKKVENPNIIHKEGSKRVELRGSMFEMLKKKYNSKIIFKLK